MCITVGGWAVSALRQTQFGAPLAGVICACYLAGALTYGAKTGSHPLWAGPEACFMALVGCIAVMAYLRAMSWGGRSAGSLLAIILILGSLVGLTHDAVHTAASELRISASAGTTLEIIGANAQIVQTTWSDPGRLSQSMVADRPQIAELILIADGGGRYALFDCEREGHTWCNMIRSAWRSCAPWPKPRTHSGNADESGAFAALNPVAVAACGTFEITGCGTATLTSGDHERSLSSSFRRRPIG
jgi:hypothetical protein